MTKKERQQRALEKVAEQASMTLQDVSALVLGGEVNNRAAATRLGLDENRWREICKSYSRVMGELATTAATGQTTMPNATKPKRRNTSTCRHRLARSTCPVCTAGIQRVVYVSGGGNKFHRTRDCRALLTGQQKVRDRDGVASTIRGVVTNAAVLDTRDGCGTCFTS